MEIKIILWIWLFLMGAIMGSFVCCQAWRVRYKELGKKKLGERSVCLKCGYKLKWYDNLPIISWIMLGGKCRKCGKKIGATEIIAEVGMGVVFLAYGIITKDQWWMMTMMLVLFAILGFLAIYDGKWGKLPMRQLIMAIVVGAMICAAKIATGKAEVWSCLAGVGILSGIYYILYVLSKERLVGGGDWLLGLALALALSDWWLALWTLFIANVMGSVVALPKMISKKKTKIYFGPYMVVAFVIVVLISENLIKLLSF